ncbi:MAG: hypothetical protein AAGF14_08385 [Pseudomonadota bacterium]
MRVLNATAEREEASGVMAMIRRYGFTVCLGVALTGYVALLASHPGADAVSVYPEPVDNFLYDANFPNQRGAEPWTKVIHRVPLAATCQGLSADIYREVSAQRCNNLIDRTGNASGISVRSGERCRYFYENAGAARHGTAVQFITSGAACLVP